MAQELTMMQGMYLEMVQEENPRMLHHLVKTGQWDEHMRQVADQADQAMREMTSSAPRDRNLRVMAREVAIEQMRQAMPREAAPPG